MEAIEKQFTKNKYNISIVMCCASCRHHMIKGDNDMRMCRKLHMEHAYDYLCDAWEMSENLECAGKGGGRVKKGSYLRYVLFNSVQNAEEWEREHGSKYLSKR